MMAVLEVYTKNIKVKYKSTILSKATFLKLTTVFLTIVAPFFLAYKSGGFWWKWDTFYEQPKINLRGEYLLIATTNNLNNPIICSSFQFFRERLDILDVCSMIKVREIDHNLDGRIDRMVLEMHLNLFGSKITALNLILPINYNLDTVCPLQMQSAIIYQHYFYQTKPTMLQILADLNVYQSGAIICHKNNLHEIYNNDIIENGDDSKSFELDHILEKYTERNVTTHLTNIYTNVRSDNNDVFKLKLSVRYPEHRINFKPDFWQVIKWAWIQYFAIYIVTLWFTSKIEDYIFNNRLVLFYEESPLKKHV